MGRQEPEEVLLNTGDYFFQAVGRHSSIKILVEKGEFREGGVISYGYIMRLEGI